MNKDFYFNIDQYDKHNNIIYKNINCDLIFIHNPKNQKINYNNFDIIKVNTLYYYDKNNINNDIIFKNLINYGTTELHINITDKFLHYNCLTNIEILHINLKIRKIDQICKQIFENCSRLSSLRIELKKCHNSDHKFASENPFIYSIPINVKKVKIRGIYFNFDFLNNIVKQYIKTNQIVNIVYGYDNYDDIDELIKLHGYDVINKFICKCDLYEDDMPNLIKYCELLSIKCNHDIFIEN